jgi:hypothetical protein
MISSTAANISRIGIMFDVDPFALFPFPHLPVNDDDNGTAGLDEHLPYRFPLVDFPGWMVVALDPRGWSYGDDDQRAIDVTNWSVIIDTAGPVHAPRWYAWTDADVAAAHGAGALSTDGVLLVSPARSDIETEQDDRVNALVDLARALCDYPLLDDDAYNTLEADAWNEYAADGLRFDTIRDMRDAAVIDAETIETIEENWSVVWPAAMRFVDYYAGFTGEHGPDFAVCIARAITDGLIHAMN